ncbi:MAG: hypothetical protein RBT34_08380 [Anaerolineaceae bacterium]|jgi:hypothetical protein|nr:hypothetical protein [Anaerolineaceae bacterium]
MRKFHHFIVFLVILSLLFSCLIRLRYDGEYPLEIGQDFDDNLRINHQEYLDREKPGMVLMGDSTLHDSVNFDQLGAALGIDAYGVAIPGSTTALWYLILKNNIVTAEHKPDYLVLFTRETMITAPEFRVDGGYFATIDEYAAADEPLLLERSYMQQMDPLEQTAARWLPIFGQRDQVRESITYRIDHTVPVLFHCGEACVKNALDAIFAGAADKKAVLAAQNQAENYLRQMEQLFFARQLNRSYLPEMERMTRENDIQLILVEMKTFRSPSSTTTTLLLNGYMRDLRAYCAEKGIVYISFADDPRLTRELFPDGFHLTEEAIPMFTDMLAEKLAGVVE